MSVDNKGMNSNSFFVSMLLILFIGLKLANIITWSWWWVMSPLWVPLVIFVIIVVPILIIIAMKGRK
jgi:hypothetical protein